VHSLPVPVERLLQSSDSASREDAWQDFVAEYNRLILHVTRSQTGSHDEAMDWYAYVLEHLQADNLRRLRMYDANGGGKFTTWLVVIVRRLCRDAVRQRYGRYRAAPEQHRERRALVDLVGADLDVELLAQPSGSLPGEELRARELYEALAAAVDELEPADRLLLRLRFQDDVAVADIARILSLPSVFHVYRRLNRLYEQLRSSLHGMGVEDASP
jgi:RNA polymerase sigma factor (sigma-70 family)